MEKRCPPDSVNSFLTPWAFRRRAIRRPPCSRTVSCASVVILAESIPPPGGSRRPPGVTGRPRGSSLARREERTRTVPEPKTTAIADADLDLLLAAADRDAPILSPPREAPAEPRESLDSQILAGLVSP